MGTRVRKASTRDGKPPVSIQAAPALVLPGRVCPASGYTAGCTSLKYPGTWLARDLHITRRAHVIRQLKLYAATCQVEAVP